MNCIIQSILAKGDLGVIDKGSETAYDPQTEADRAAQYLIVQSLQKKFKNICIIGEEVRREMGNGRRYIHSRRKYLKWKYWKMELLLMFSIFLSLLIFLRSKNRMTSLYGLIPSMELLNWPELKTRPALVSTEVDLSGDV